MSSSARSVTGRARIVTSSAPRRNGSARWVLGGAGAFPARGPRAGRLVAFGRSPAARSDARHVAVEFVHPVIVGKRALPAIGLAAEGGDLAGQVALIAAPDDVAMGFGAD